MKYAKKNLEVLSGNYSEIDRRKMLDLYVSTNYFDLGTENLDVDVVENSLVGFDVVKDVFGIDSLKECDVLIFLRNIEAVKMGNDELLSYMKRQNQDFGIFYQLAGCLLLSVAIALAFKFLAGYAIVHAALVGAGALLSGCYYFAFKIKKSTYRTVAKALILLLATIIVVIAFADLAPLGIVAPIVNIAGLASLSFCR